MNITTNNNKLWKVELLGKHTTPKGHCIFKYGIIFSESETSSIHPVTGLRDEDWIQFQVKAYEVLKDKTTDQLCLFSIYKLKYVTVEKGHFKFIKEEE